MRIIDSDHLKARLQVFYLTHIDEWCQERAENTSTLIDNGYLNEAIEGEKMQTALHVIGSALALINDTKTVEVLTDSQYFTVDEIETIRIHLSAFKEELCNQRRWSEALEYEELIDKLLLVPIKGKEKDHNEQDGQKEGRMDTHV